MEDRYASGGFDFPAALLSVVQLADRLHDDLDAAALMNPSATADEDDVLRDAKPADD